ncbi:hypothetical protein EK904_012860, partial [Melospiza melodia maxima]
CLETLFHLTISTWEEKITSQLSREGDSPVGYLEKDVSQLMLVAYLVFVTTADFSKMSGIQMKDLWTVNRIWRIGSVKLAFTFEESSQGHKHQQAAQAAKLKT